MTPEFSRIVDGETVSEAGRQVEIDADEVERRKLASRFALRSIDALSASVRVFRRAGAIQAEGQVDADIVQNCVVTGEPLTARIVAPVLVRFVPDAYAPRVEEEFELSAEDCDTLPLEANRIDLGELAAETLALALDPFPRSKNADAAPAHGGLADKSAAGPFAALKGLKDTLEKRGG